MGTIEHRATRFPERHVASYSVGANYMTKSSANETFERRILLIDDSAIALKALRTVLGLHPTWEIVGKAENGQDGLRLFREKDPHVVILDFQMPGSAASR